MPAPACGEVHCLTRMACECAGYAGGSAWAEGSPCGLCGCHSARDPQAAHDGSCSGYTHTPLDVCPQRCFPLSIDVMILW